jgi:hypothetical protein
MWKWVNFHCQDFKKIKFSNDVNLRKCKNQLKCNIVLLVETNEKWVKFGNKWSPKMQNQSFAVSGNNKMDLHNGINISTPSPSTITSTYLPTYLPVYGATALCWTLATFSVSWSFYTVGRTPWTGNQPVARLLPTHRTTHTQNKCTQTSMPQVGFKPTIPVLELAKTVHALECVATVIGTITCMPVWNITCWH